jgi:hypothetical protein
MRYWSPLEAKTIMTSSLPHFETQPEWSINDFKPCICGKFIVAWGQYSIYKLIVALSMESVHYIYIKQA